MKTFAPRQFFLRVGDKFVPNFVDHDPALKSGPCLLYIRLFARCGNRDHCTLSQKELAKLCKCSVRSVQNHVRAPTKQGGGILFPPMEKRKRIQPW